MPAIIALDTNVLLLLLVGTAKPSYIEKHQCLGAYTPTDFETLQRMVEQFDELVTLPNVMSEVGNMLGSTHGPREPLFEVLQAFAGMVREIYLPTAQAVKRPEFSRLEVSDCALIEIAKDNVFILTADGHLYRALTAAGYQTENFTYHTEAGRAE